MALAPRPESTYNLAPVTKSDRGELYPNDGILIMSQASGQNTDNLRLVRTDGSLLALDNMSRNVGSYPIELPQPILRRPSTDDTFDGTVLGLFTGETGYIPSRGPERKNASPTGGSVRRDVSSKTKVCDVAFIDPDGDGVTISTTMTVVSKAGNTDANVLSAITIEVDSTDTSTAEIFYTRPSAAANDLPSGKYVLRVSATDDFDTDPDTAGVQGTTGTADYEITLLPGQSTDVTNITVREREERGGANIRSATLTDSDNEFELVVEHPIDTIKVEANIDRYSTAIPNYDFAPRGGDLEWDHLGVGVSQIPFWVLAEDGSIEKYYLEVDRRGVEHTYLANIVEPNNPSDSNFVPATFDPFTLEYEYKLGTHHTTAQFRFSKRRLAQSIRYRYADQGDPYPETWRTPAQNAGEGQELNMTTSAIPAGALGHVTNLEIEVSEVRPTHLQPSFTVRTVYFIEIERKAS